MREILLRRKPITLPSEKRLRLSARETAKLSQIKRIISNAIQKESNPRTKRVLRRLKQIVYSKILFSRPESKERKSILDLDRILLAVSRIKENVSTQQEKNMKKTQEVIIADMEKKQILANMEETKKPASGAVQEQHFLRTIRGVKVRLSKSRFVTKISIINLRKFASITSREIKNGRSENIPRLLTQTKKLNDLINVLDIEPAAPEKLSELSSLIAEIITLRQTIVLFEQEKKPQKQKSSKTVKSTLKMREDLNKGIIISEIRIALNNISMASALQERLPNRAHPHWKRANKALKRIGIAKKAEELTPDDLDNLYVKLKN